MRSKVKFDPGYDSFGAVTISGVYSQYLDNGFTRFIVEYSVTMTMEISVFDPPRAALFNLQRESADADVPGRLVFDLKNEDLKQLNSVTVRFYSQRTGNYYLSLYPEPCYLTDGKPVGEIQEVVYTLGTDLPLPSGDMTVSSLTAQGLDNGYTRFTLEYTVPEKLTVSIFNAPYADHFMFFTKSADAGEPGTLVFDLADEDIRAIDYITLKFFNTDTGEHNCVSVKTLQFNIDHSLLLADLSDGQAVGEATAVTYIPYNYEPENISWNVSGVTAQKLDTGYMRFTVEYTLSTAMKIDLMADQYEFFWVPGFSLYEPGKQQLVFDLNMEDFQTYAYYLLSFTEGVHGETAVLRCGLVFYTDQFG